MSKKGVKKPEGFGLKIAEINRHRIFSQETRLKIGLKNKSRKHSDESKKKHSEYIKNHPMTKETREKIIKLNKERSGDKHPGWKGGISKTKEYKARHFILSHRKRRNLKLNAGGFHTEEQWNFLKEKYFFTCPRCKRIEPEIVLHRDHILPLSKGGSDNIENIQPLCKSCNSWKHCKIIKYEI